MKATETRNIHKQQTFVTAVFQEGTDLEEELGLKWHHRLYLSTDVELLSQLG
jgi:hypothetical protein